MRARSESKKSKESRELGERLARLCAKPPESMSDDQVESMIKGLIEEGAELNQKAVGARHQRSALGWCAIQGKTAWVRALAKAGASLEACDERGGEAPLMEAVDKGDLEMIQELLRWGARTEARSGSLGMTPLMRAAQGELAPIQLLLAAGADTRAVDGDGDTALHWAALNGNLEVVQALWKKDPIESQNQKGLTPVMAALSNGCGKVALWLIRQGARARERTAQGPMVAAFEALKNDALSEPGDWAELFALQGELQEGEWMEAAVALGGFMPSDNLEAIKQASEWLERSCGERRALSALSMALGAGLARWEDQQEARDSLSVRWMKAKISALEESRELREAAGAKASPSRALSARPRV